jgi:hypothetical protein
MQKKRLKIIIMGICACFILIACDRGADQGDKQKQKKVELSPTKRRKLPNSVLTIGKDTVIARPLPNKLRNAYFGDLHVHTTYSFDAFAFGTLATPVDAYQYAKGKAIRHPGGFDVQLRQPLDFYAVTDHAMFLGLLNKAADTTTEFSKYDVSKPVHDLNKPKSSLFRFLPKGVRDIVDGLFIMKRLRSYRSFIPGVLDGVRDGSLDKELIDRTVKTAWLDIIHAAQSQNEPGQFTTFIGFEYTSATNDIGNLHRNVIFKDDFKLPAIPFSRFHSQNPEGLWDWMDGLRAQGIESLAIPHNSNASNGQMFKLADWAGNPMDGDYITQRVRNEPLVELTQIKGSSDTHPALSPNDEWADFEIAPFKVSTQLPSEPNGSYIRQALQRGLTFEEKVGANPYKFGFIGGSDTHTAAISDDESNYHGKMGVMDKTTVLRGSTPMSELQAYAFRKVGADKFMTNLKGQDYTYGASEYFGTAGLSGIWAEENTRESLYNALRRRETFATSGPRIQVRFFAGYDFNDDMIDSHDMVAKAYADGVSMGSDLTARGGAAPKFLVWAVRDPKSAALQRVQIIKGWIADGEPKEKVYDVACSDGLKVDPSTHRCPDNGARVNLADCSITAEAGDAELKTVWTDPEFDAEQRAFYYVRALENPTCRWSTWDAVRAGVEPRSDLKKTIQERAWSSPIWYKP